MSGTKIEVPNFKTKIILGKGVVKDVLEILKKNHDDTCFYCGKQVTEKNFGAVTKETGLVCDNIVCAMEFFTDYGEK